MFACKMNLCISIYFYNNCFNLTLSTASGGPCSAVSVMTSAIKFGTWLVHHVSLRHGRISPYGSTDSGIKWPGCCIFVENLFSSGLDSCRFLLPFCLDFKTFATMCQSMSLFSPIPLECEKAS